MKWYEIADDCGDGTTRRIRFRTKEEADQARAIMEDSPMFQQDGDGSPVITVDTESKYFFSTVDEIKEQFE